MKQEIRIDAFTETVEFLECSLASMREIIDSLILSSLEPKAKSIFSDQIFPLSVVVVNFTFSSSSHETTKLRTKHPWVMGIQVCSSERSSIFPKGDNNEIAKYIDENVYSSEPPGQFIPNLTQNNLG